MSGPTRAHKLICVIQADDRDSLIMELEHFAREIARGQLTQGVSGGYSSGTIYSYAQNPEQTHDSYFQQLEAHLDEERRRTALTGGE